jgi:dTDP-4-amino-4,6-dideoxygalactose transaminase
MSNCARGALWTALFLPADLRIPHVPGTAVLRNARIYPVANDVAERVICLPIYPALTNEQIDMVVSQIKRPCNVGG